MQQLLRAAAEAGNGYVVCSAHPRLVDGKPSKNPRYLQTRPDLLDPTARYIAERGMRLARALTAGRPLHAPVGAVLLGRRNNPPEPEAGIRPLAVYSPIHYQELPELFMDFICSLTGKSPSTTGAGSEGALTKGPFNALRPILDLNAALVSYILTGLAGFSTAAGYVGPKMQVDHDISLLIPEIWCRLNARRARPGVPDRRGTPRSAGRLRPRGTPGAGQPAGLSDHGQVRPHVLRAGLRQPGPRLRRGVSPARDAGPGGLRGRRPQHHRGPAAGRPPVLRGRLDRGRLPPLRALLSIMAEGSFEGKDAHHPDIRGMFRLDALLASDWYRQRLIAKRRGDERLWRRHLDYLDALLAGQAPESPAELAELCRRREYALAELERIKSPAYLDELNGALGLDPSLLPPA